jgi:hypothetical protein
VKTQLFLDQQVEVNVKLNKDLFLSFLRAVKISGIDSLIAYLLKSDYFIAPASTPFYNVFSCGLRQHSLNVMQRFAIENQE